ncbi:MAG: ribonuclease P protein component [Candidatus Pacebacteria bacterium]|nr:ribonuclease P protein component [Candidatus Paceibacterota bacterium]
MLSKEKRINTILFDEILKLGNKRYFKYFYILVLENDKQKNSHIAFVVPKKQFKKAIDRNNIKRKCSGIIKDIYLNIPSSLNIIFFLKKEIEELNFQELQSEITNSLNDF